MFLPPYSSAEPAAGGKASSERGWRVAGSRAPGSVSVCSHSSSVCFSFNASGQDRVWVSGFCAKFLENHPPKGIVSVLIQSESFSVLPILDFYPAICAGMSTFSFGPLLLSTWSFLVQLLKEKPLSTTSFKLIFIVFCFLK